MDEDGGAKAAPVTRLRRRLSVEAEETKSPSAPATPTKKRPTRLAAKPQLELIDEHAVTSSPKRSTRKSISRDKVEPDEKPSTPARRSTRTKSNTSLVSEAEEKPLTPARRSTRIKSNTSLVSETTQSVESPRAKRAVARRNSQVGSDNEAPLTPARARRARIASTSSIEKEETPSISESAITPGRTRRGRKGSTSSIDAPAETALVEKPSLITEVIIEEPESKHRKSTSDKDNVDNNDDSPNRKSPRLMAKKSRKSKSEDTNEIQKQSQDQDEHNDQIPTSTTEHPRQNALDISVSSANLIKDLDAFNQIQKKNSNKNKSMSDIDDTVESKKRYRTKSWTTLCASSPRIDGNFYSDNESNKKKLKKNRKILNEERLGYGGDTGSGDGVNQNVTKGEKDKELSSDTSKKNRKSRNSLISNKTENASKSDEELNTNTSKMNGKSRNSSINVNLQNNDKSMSGETKDVDISNESNKENLELEPVTKDTSGAEYLFENAPSADVKSMVFIEDSDSNSVNLSKEVKQISSEDQCVPVVLQKSEIENNSEEQQASSTIFALNNIDKKKTNDDSVEPMDIDETMPENISLTVFADESKQPRKSSLCIPQENSVSKDSPNKSKINSQSLVFNDSDAKDDKMQNKKTRKSSANVTQDLAKNAEESTSSSKRNSLSQSTVDIKADNKNKNTPSQSLNISKDESMSGKKSRKSSVMFTQESDKSLTENPNKSKRKSKSISEDNFENYTKSSVTVGENVCDEISLKSPIAMAQDSDNSYKEINKTKKNSSLSNSMTHDKTGNEDKSTLKLSQIKDVSAAEDSVSDSPRKYNNLSKSINIEETNKDSLVNKNLTLNYLTSTPVQQKKIDKLAMQMNTSVITPTNTSKKVSKSSENKPNQNVSAVSKSSSNESSDEDIDNSEEEDSSLNRSNLFDDKAEDAGEDYESGDSQDEDERQFERENEIIDKGETLSSEEEISNDSDYEKDSFIVSSDEADNELLSGSGDDLNLSDNELTLSAKSKKKYNERMLKEQKKASKEMFEARHGSNLSSKDVKSKKNNRSRLDSTLLKSDEDILPPKKNKRMRLDSTVDTSQTKSDSEEIGYKKKKSKRLSESIYNESVINEKEITIYNLDKIQTDDPLLVQIKTEPKTPQKELDISRVHFTNDVELVHVDENKSMMKFNDTNDPLQEESESDDDSISENEEITNNYGSLLEELNKESKKQIKSHDVSLNLIKKDKQQKKTTIIDELNLTQTRISKKDTSLLAKEKSVKRVFKKLADTDESSDSIDLQLLFSDDSSDKKNDSKKTNSEDPDGKGSFISLKKTEAKTNIHQNKGDIGNDDEGLKFFIDTKGDFDDNATTGNDAAGNESDSDDAPVKVLYIKEKKNNLTPSEKNKKISESQESILQEQNTVLATTPASKKNKKMESYEIENQILKTPSSEKKKKLLHETVTSPESKTPISEKKKENKLSKPVQNARNESLGQQEIAVTVEDTVNHPRKRKRKQSANKTADNIEFNGIAQVLNTSHQQGEIVLGNKNKKLKTSTSIDDSQTLISIPASGSAKNELTALKTSKSNKLIKQQQAVEISEPETKISKKRKERDEDKGGNVSKVFKENSFDKVHVPRLPSTIIEQLGNLPSEGPLQKKTKSKAVSTSTFVVEETKRRKNKPSDFMEETVYLNDDKDTAVKKKSNTKKPKVLPFLPTVSTSDSGFTTNFHVNVISQTKMEFRAQSNGVPNFKNDYLNNKKIKKLRTYDLYKKQRNMKLSKY